MRILYFIECMSKGGKERRLFELIRNLRDKKEFEIFLLTLRPDSDFPELQNVVINHSFIGNGPSKNWLMVLFKCFRAILRFKPGIVHTWGDINSLIAVLLKPFFAYSLVNSQITAAPAVVKRSFLFHTIPFTFSEVITANSKAGLLAYCPPKNKSQVIYNGFDFNRTANLLSSDNIKVELGITSEFVVGMFSNFTPAKDYPLFFAIAQKILEKMENVTFVCAGKGDFTGLFADLSETARLRFRVMGPSDEVEQLMSICDIGLQLTNTHGHGEGISNSILELCALGKCVIATNCGGSPEIIENGVSGFLVGNNADSVSDLIESLLRDSSKRVEIGNNAREVIKSKFSIERMIDDFRKIYEGCAVN
ncbi:MAG: glycosyltransferase [Bacteroidetes bacterium]|nr:glycosyltransferase [Bacteroidota bacterium]